MNGNHAFRVFISSTFEDLARERGVLSRLVFPLVAEACARRGASFRAVDLRWGISEAASRQRRTVDVCLDEVRRCVAASPSLSMILLLGDRYGWRPMPARVDRESFELLVAAMPSADRRLLRASYRLDENAHRPDYVLLPRAGAGRPERGDAAEPALRALLDDALAATLSADDPRQIAYGASATHLEVAEVLRISPPGAGNVIVFAREHGAGNADDDSRRLEAFDAAVVEHVGPESVHRYSTAGDPDLTAFGARLQRELMRRIDAILSSAAEREDGEEPMGTSLFRAHAVRRTRITTGLARVSHAVDEYLRGEATEPLVITGRFGAGRSTALAKAYLDSRSGDGALVVGRFVGAVPEWTNRDDLLHGLCTEIDANDPAAAPPPWRGLELERFFAQRLTAPQMRPLHVYIDAAEQLEAPADTEGPASRWIPARTAPGVKLVLTVSNDPGASGELYRRLREFLPDESFVDVGELSEQEAEHLLDAWLAAAGRRLQPAQRAAVLSRFRRCRRPLLLRLATDRALRWRSYDPPRLGEDIDGVVRDALDELAADADHGRILVHAVIGYLSSARFGLADDEMMAVLESDEGVMSDLTRRSPYWSHSGAFPYVVWARLRADLGPFVADHQIDGVIVSALAGAAIRRVIAGQVAVDASDAHRRLSRLFSGGLAQPTPRVLSELPFQLTRARKWTKLATTLCDPLFIDAKCSAGRTGDLVHDYERALAALRAAEEDAGRTEVTALRAWSSFVLSQRASFEEYAPVAGFVLQQVSNEGGADLPRFAGRTLARPGAVWFRRDRAADEGEAVVIEAGRHRAGATDCVFTATGELLFSSGMDGQVLVWSTRDWNLVDVAADLDASVDSCDVSPDGQLVATACADGFVRIHDRLRKTVVVCEGRFDRGPRRCRFTRDGASVVAVGQPGVVVYAATSGVQRTSALPDHIVNDATVTGPDTVIVGDCDGGVHLIATGNAKVRHTCRLDNARRAQGACVSPDGRLLLAVGGTFQYDDGMAPFGERRLWDISGGRPVDEHAERLDKPALNCLFVDEGRYYVVGLSDGSVHVFRTVGGTLVKKVGAHDGGVRGMALSPDGALVATAAFDGAVKVWKVGDLIGENLPTSGERGLYCLLDATGRGWAVTARVDGFFADMSVRPVPAAPAGGRKRLERPRELAGIPLARDDRGLEVRAFSWIVPEPGHRSAHRTSPIARPGRHWLMQAPARMTPTAYHLLPDLDSAFWAEENVTWAGSPSGDFVGLVRRHMRRHDAGVAWAIELLICAVEPWGIKKLLESTFTVPLTWRAGNSGFDPQESRFLVAAGPVVYSLPLLPSATVSFYGEEDFSDEAVAVRAFSPSPDDADLAVAYDNGTIKVFDADARTVRAAWRAHRGEVIDCCYMDESTLLSIGVDGTLKLWKTTGEGPRAVFVARNALAAFDTDARSRRVVALDVHGTAYSLVVDGEVSG